MFPLRTASASELRAMAFPQDKVSGHGFRATARTMLTSGSASIRTSFEAQLAHSVRDGLGRAYNCTGFVEQRRKMLQGRTTWTNCGGARPSCRLGAASG